MIKHNEEKKNLETVRFVITTTSCNYALCRVRFLFLCCTGYSTYNTTTCPITTINYTETERSKTGFHGGFEDLFHYEYSYTLSCNIVILYYDCKSNIYVYTRVSIRVSVQSVYKNPVEMVFMQWYWLYFCFHTQVCWCSVTLCAVCQYSNI